MAGDIKLNDGGVEVVGVLQVDGWDILLDCKDRRGPDVVSEAQ